MKFYLTLLLSFSQLVHSSEIEMANKKFVLKPTTYQWEDLKKIYSKEDLNKSSLQQNFQCTNNESMKLVGSYYQNILYNDYTWDLYHSQTHESLCIKMKQPQIGFLTESESLVFTAASKGFLFLEKGFWDESINYAKSIQNHLHNCSQFSDKVTLQTNSPSPPPQKPTFSLKRNHLREQFNAELESIKSETQSRKSPHYQYGEKFSFNSSCFEELNSETKENKVVIGSDDRTALLNNVFIGENYPWMAFIKYNRGNNDLACRAKGSGFYINPHSIVTAAHNIKYQACEVTKWTVRSTNRDGTSHTTVARNSRYTTSWRDDSGYNFNDFTNDFGMLVDINGFYIPLFPAIYLGTLFPLYTDIEDYGLNLGYPIYANGSSQSGVLHYEERTAFDDNFVLDPLDSDPMLAHFFDQTEGQSGGPLFFTHYSNTPHQIPVVGINSIVVGTTNYTTPIDSSSGGIIAQWATEQPPNVIIDITSPANMVVIDWFELTSTSFNASYESTNKNAKNKDIENNLTWSSDINGNFGSGTSVTESEAKSVLRPGFHQITVGINTPSYLGEEKLFIEIQGPQGSFQVSNTYCIVDLALGNHCSLPISWSTNNAPDAFVYNETSQAVFSTSNQGSNVPITLTPGMDVTLTLYADVDKFFDIDEVTLSAKTPTGTLSKPSPQCSLQPGPQFNANGDLINDPQATPSACGTELTWSNVQWASPGIFYKPVGSGSWQLLYQIPCDLDGEVCSGSIHTDNFQPGLIAASGSGSGYEFKLLQFTDPGSGQLSAPFSVTAHRFADAYEFDDGWFEVPISGNQQEVKTRMLAWGGMISNQMEVGQSQQGHNFHRPAAYDDGIDVDTFDIQSPVPVLGDENAQIEFIVSNMASNLDVTFEIQCVGLKDFRAGPNDDIEPISGVWEIPFNQIASNTRSGNVRKMTFNYFKRHTGYVDEQFIDLPACTKNRVVVKRTSGQPSENLSYDVSVNLVGGNSNTPELESAAEMNTTTYKVELIGENFGVNTANNIRVSVRENVNGSQPLAVYSSDFFHNIGTHVSSHAHAGKDFIRFPIIKTNRQNIFRNNGLCFKVLSDTLTSNEVCRQIPARTPLPGFAGATVQSYHNTDLDQDIDSEAYVTKTNGNMLKLWGNSWKKIPLNYTVTPNTELKIDFKSTHGEAEFVGVGFIMQGHNQMASSRFWQFHGSHTWGIQAQNNYSGTAYKTYTINIGEQFTGQISHMVFVADNDAQSKAQNVVFLQPYLSENISGMDAYDDVPAQRAFDDDTVGRGVSWAAGDTSHSHTFHDLGDQDWTIVFAEDFNVNTTLIGSGADTKLTVYRWLSADYNTTSGQYENVVQELVGQNNAPGPSEFVVRGSESYVYAIKAESRNNVIGADSAYKLIIDPAPPFGPDSYDDVPAQRAYDDDVVERPVSWESGMTVKEHNFHDSGDTDWTIVAARNIRVQTELVGSESDTKVTVYKWTGGVGNPDGTFSNITQYEVGRDWGTGPSSIDVFSNEDSVFAIKVESRTGAYGENTDYKLRLLAIPNGTPDAYDQVPTQRAYDDDTEGRSVSWAAGDTFHYHNFHDSGDVDWTIVYGNQFTIKTEALGSNASTKMTVYKWNAAEIDEENEGQFINIQHQFVGQDINGGDAQIYINNATDAVYAIKVESANHAYGNDTSYRLRVY